MDEEDDEDEEGKESKERKRKQNETFLQSDSFSVKGFLSSIPAPRNSATLGVASLGSGSGRRSVIETDGSTSSSGPGLIKVMRVVRITMEVLIKMEGIM